MAGPKFLQPESRPHGGAQGSASPALAVGAILEAPIRRMGSGPPRSAARRRKNGRSFSSAGLAGQTSGPAMDDPHDRHPARIHLATPRTNPTRVLPNLAHSRTASGQARPNTVGPNPTWLNSAQTWPSSIECGRNWSKHSQVRPKSVACLVWRPSGPGRIWVTQVGQARSTFDRAWPSMANLALDARARCSGRRSRSMRLISSRTRPSPRPNLRPLRCALLPQTRAIWRGPRTRGCRFYSLCAGRVLNGARNDIRSHPRMQSQAHTGRRLCGLNPRAQARTLQEVGERVALATPKPHNARHNKCGPSSGTPRRHEHPQSLAGASTRTQKLESPGGEQRESLPRRDNPEARPRHAVISALRVWFSGFPVLSHIFRAGGAQLEPWASMFERLSETTDAPKPRAVRRLPHEAHHGRGTTPLCFVSENAHFWPLASLAQPRDTCWNPGHTCRSSGQVRPKSPQSWPTPGRTWASAQSRLQSRERSSVRSVCQTRPKSPRRCWVRVPDGPTATPVEGDVAQRVGPHLANVGPDFATLGASASEVAPSFARLGPESAFGRTIAEKVVAPDPIVKQEDESGVKGHSGPTEVLLERPIRHVFEPRLTPFSHRQLLPII